MGGVWSTLKKGPHYREFKPPIKDTPKEDKPLNKVHAESTRVYTLCTKSPPKEDNLSTKDKMACPESVLYKRFHCNIAIWLRIRVYCFFFLPAEFENGFKAGGIHCNPLLQE